jgi:hypothetical protein
MNYNRQSNVQTSAKSAVNSLFSSARFSHLTSDTINERFLEIKKNLPKGTPRHISAFLDGMREVHNDRLMRDELEFCYLVTGQTENKKGKMLTFENHLVTTDRKSGSYYEAVGIQPSELQKISVSSGFYYKGTRDIYFSTPNAYYAKLYNRAG